MQTTKQLKIDNLPAEAQRELFDFFEFLSAKYKKHAASSEKSKQAFMQLVAKHSFNLPDGYKFSRDEIYER
jgi:hypothetical protein